MKGYAMPNPASVPMYRRLLPAVVCTALFPLRTQLATLCSLCLQGPLLFAPKAF